MEWKIVSKLQSKSGIIATGIISILSSIGFLMFRGHWILDTEWSLHVSSLELFTSSILIVGAVKGNYKLLAPWLIMTVFFIYMLIFACIKGSQTFYYNTMVVIIFFSVFLPIIGFLCCALCAVQMKFEQLRKEQPPSYTAVTEKPFNIPTV